MNNVLYFQLHITIILYSTNAELGSSPKTFKNEKHAEYVILMKGNPIGNKNKYIFNPSVLVFGNLA